MFFSSGVFGSDVRVSEKTVSLRDPPEAGLTKSGLFLFNSYQFRGSINLRRASKRAGEFEARIMSSLNRVELEFHQLPLHAALRSRFWFEV
jgi:hypothetical protein